MQFSILALTTLLATLIAASPVEIRQLGGLCGSALDTPQCCDVSIDGAVNLGCASPSSDPGSVEEFQVGCNARGKGAYCCVVTIVGDALVCTAV